jgi:hypothetical protein
LLGGLIEKLEQQLKKQAQEPEEKIDKVALADYLRLLELQKELEEEEPTEIRVTWVDPEMTTASET